MTTNLLNVDLENSEIFHVLLSSMRECAPPCLSMANLTFCRVYTALYMLCLWNCVMIPSVHMPSIGLSILERDPPLLLS